MPGNPELSRCRRAVIFGACFLVILSQNLYFSFPLPFLANETIKREGNSELVGGVLVAGFPLVGGITSLLANKLTASSSVKSVVVGTSLLFLLSSLVFLVKMSGILFTVVVFLARLCQGVALGLAEPKVVAVMGGLYPDWLGGVTAVYELAFSISLSLGPLLGGGLYEVGGFYLPFLVTGILTVLVGGAAFLILPSDTSRTAEETSSTKHPLLTVPVFILGIFVMSSVAAAEGYLSGFMGPYLLTHYGKTEAVTGLILMASGVLYSAATALFGYLTDKYSSRSVVVVLGFGAMIVSSALMDVSRQRYEVPSCMFAVLEVGSAMVQVSVLPLMVYHDKEPELEASTERMTGIYNAGFFMGACLGPLVGGGLLTRCSYHATFVIQAICLGGVLGVLFLLQLKFRNLLRITKKMEEHTPLLK